MKKIFLALAFILLLASYIGIKAQSLSTDNVIAEAEDGWTTKCTGDSSNKCRASFTGSSCYTSGEGTRCKSHSSTPN